MIFLTGILSFGIITGLISALSLTPVVGSIISVIVTLFTTSLAVIINNKKDENIKNIPKFIGLTLIFISAGFLTGSIGGYIINQFIVRPVRTPYEILIENNIPEDRAKDIIRSVFTNHPEILFQKYETPNAFFMSSD